MGNTERLMKGPSGVPNRVQRIGFAGGLSNQLLFKTLENLFPVQFEQRAAGEYQDLAAIVLSSATNEEIKSAKRWGVHVYGHLEGSATIHWEKGARIRFADVPTLDWPLRGRQMEHRAAITLQPIAPGESQTVVASINDGPVWVAERQDGPVCYIVSAGLPECVASESVAAYLNGSSFLSLLPMVQFLRHVTRGGGWSPPKPRAAFMFDDPNLHGATYGYLDYASLAIDAVRHNYHVSLATIPLDTWFSSRKAVALFAEKCKSLSLLVHGNNHVRNELAQYRSDDQRIRSLAQAMQRIERLERSTGLSVSRIMAAPHGACSEETLHVLARLGYEAACISHGALCFHNRGKRWIAKVGFEPAEMIAGLPVISRFRLDSKCESSVLMAAYLNQPIIAVGHHNDVAAGISLLGDLADFINSLGPVEWMDMRGIARSNYSTRREGSLLRVKPYSRVFEVTVPPGVSELAIEAAWVSTAHACGIQVQTPDQAQQCVCKYHDEPLHVRNGDRLQIAAIHRSAIDPAFVRPAAVNVSAIARRLATEGRDRLLA